MAWKFLLLENGLKFLDDCSIHVIIFSKLVLVLFFPFTPQVRLFFVEQGNLKFSD